MVAAAAMSRDPYHEFAQDVERALRQAASHEGACRSGDARARTALASSLSALAADLGELRESVRVVEQSGPARFGVDTAELDRRKRFVEQSARELTRLERVARDTDTRPPPDDRSAYPSASLAWEQEQQEMLLANQDQALGQIGSTLTSLRSQAELIGQETDEHAVMLQGLDAGVDSTQTRLNAALKRMDRFVARTDARLGDWCAWLLIAALFVLLLVAVLI